MPDDTEPAVDGRLLVMAGEPGDASIILQCRLHNTDSLVESDWPGRQGQGCFEISEDSAFVQSLRTPVQYGNAANDYTIKVAVNDLKYGTQYYYRAVVRYNENQEEFVSQTASFRTFPDPAQPARISFAMSTGFNYEKFYGIGRPANSGKGPIAAAVASREDQKKGFEAFETIRNMDLDFFVANGDVVYYDSPTEKPELHARTRPAMLAKWHRYFSMPRNRDMMRTTPVYYLKDDHDHRYNDCDTTNFRGDIPSHQLGIRVFREAVPVVDPQDPQAVTYRTYRAGRLLQIWMVEGRDYRSPNRMEDGPGKTIWGSTQMNWLKSSLLASDADFKILISPTPFVGPDDAYKIDNHTNPGGFQYERQMFAKWLKSHGFDEGNFYFLCGDRHWQYHSIDPDGFEEFSSGAFVDQNSRPGRLPGDPKSTDPDALIKTPYIQGEGMNHGGFVRVTVELNNEIPLIHFAFYDTHGTLQYETSKQAQ